MSADEYTFYEKSGEEKIKTSSVGISDYGRAQAEYYYVDKTLLIKRVFGSKTVSLLIYQTEAFWKNLKYGYAESLF